MQSGVNTVLKGPDGKISATRISTLVVVFTVMGTFLAHNISSIIAGKSAFISMGMNEVILIASVLGCKVAQHFSENKKMPSTLTTNNVVSGASSSAQSDADEDADMAKV